jgi:tyrosyl-tRNA synthetase
MSKSLGNYIGIGEAASVAYGKLMSMSDNLMWRYFELLLYKTKAEIQVMQEGIVTEAVHPMDIKKMMALAIVSRFWSKDEALQAQKQFEALFQHKDYSAAVEVDVCSSLKNPCWIVDLLKAVGGVTTSSEAKRLIDAGAVQLDEKSITDFKAEVVLKPGMIVKVGKKRIYKIG